jgi:hypothetical protein
MKYALALAIAASFWHAHGVTLPCHPAAAPVPYSWFADHNIAGALSAAYRYNELPDCRIYLSPGARSDQWYDPPYYCEEIVHEAGNIAGIPENTAGLPVTSTWQTWQSVPGSCRHWRRWRRRAWGY